MALSKDDQDTNGENQPEAPTIGNADTGSADAIGETLTATPLSGEARAAAIRQATGTRPEVREGDRIGRFTVLRELGAGGMGVVLAAHDPKLDRKVALKLLKPQERGRDRDSLQMRLMREARALAKLNHPNVIAIHDVGTHGDEIFIAEELVDGQDLRAWRAESPKPWREVLDVFRQAGRALAAAHAAGIVHRDFKPGNVVVDREGRVRVLDFGLAKRLEDLPAEPESASVESLVSADTVVSPESDPSENLETRTGTVLGTPLYMAPEQHLRQAAGEQSDLFAFCVTLYESLYGEPPFAGDCIAELQRNVTQGNVREPPPASRVPGWVRRVLLRGLRPTPEERYPSMDALLAELANDPAEGRRRKLVVTAIAVTFALAGALGVVAVLWGTGAFDKSPLLAGVKSPAESSSADQAMSDDEKSATRYWQEGTKQYDLRNYTRAIGLYRKGFEAAPAPFFLYNIAQAYRLQGDCQSAIYYYKRYLSQARYVVRRDMKVEQQVRDRIAELEKTCKPEGDASASRLPARAAPDAPTSEELEELRARATDFENTKRHTREFIRSRKPRRAVASASGYSQRNPEDIPGKQLYAEALMSAGEYDRAREILSGVLSAHPEDADSLALRCRVEVRRGEYDKGMPDCLRAVEIAPKHADHLVDLAEALYGLGKLSDAKANLDRALDLVGIHPRADLLLGTILRREGDLRGAIRHHVRAAENDFDNPRARYELGITQNHAGDDEAAATTLRHALELAPDEPDYWFAYAEAQSVLKQWDTAARAYRVVLEIDPSHEKAKAQLAIALRELEEKAPKDASP